MSLARRGTPQSSAFPSHWRKDTRRQAARTQISSHETLRLLLCSVFFPFFPSLLPHLFSWQSVELHLSHYCFFPFFSCLVYLPFCLIFHFSCLFFILSFCLRFTFLLFSFFCFVFPPFLVSFSYFFSLYSYLRLWRLSWMQVFFKCPMLPQLRLLFCFFS